jgi:hypothetical protein
MVQRVQMLGDYGKGRLPVDGLVVGRARWFHHRMCDAPLLAEPVFAPGVEVGNAVLGEEFRRGACCRGFLSHRLSAVLAELCLVAMLRVWVGPGAAHAVEPVRLIQLHQCLRGADQAHVVEGPPHRDCDCLNTGRTVLWLGDGQLGRIDILLRWWVPTSRFRHRSLSNLSPILPGRSWRGDNRARRPDRGLPG